MILLKRLYYSFSWCQETLGVQVFLLPFFLYKNSETGFCRLLVLGECTILKHPGDDSQVVRKRVTVVIILYPWT